MGTTELERATVAPMADARVRDAGELVARWNALDAAMRERAVQGWAANADVAAACVERARDLGRPPHADADVVASVVLERARQDAKWGEPTDRPDGTGGPRRERAADAAKNRTDAHAAAGSLTWQHILAEEVAEAFAATDPVALRVELVQVAAVAVKWVRMIDSRPTRADGSTR